MLIKIDETIISKKRIYRQRAHAEEIWHLAVSREIMKSGLANCFKQSRLRLQRYYSHVKVIQTMACKNQVYCLGIK